MPNEYDFDDEDDDDMVALATVDNAMGKRSGGKKQKPYADYIPDLGEAITNALGEGKVQRYPNLDEGEIVRPLPKLRPGNQLPDPDNAFDWARPDNVKQPKKPNKKPTDVTGLTRKQKKKAVNVPGIAPLFDFLNMYRHAKGGWK